MRAIEFNKEIILHENYPKPEPKTGEALIRVHLAGICNTDLEITKGYMGFSGILGHEFVGTVEEINDQNKELLGKRVVGEINCACGNCRYCDNNLKTHCPNRSVLGIFNRNGCFADYVTLPVENLLEIPDSVSDEEAVFVEPLAAAFEILEQIDINRTDNILILGDGKLGLLVALVLKLTKANVLLIGKHKNKLEIAQNQDIKTKYLDELTINRNSGIVVEATGSIDGFELAQKLVKPRGTIVLKSTVAGEKNINLAPIVIDEITVVGSRCGPFLPAIQALKNKLINVKPLISGIFTFEQAKDSFEFNKSKESVKVLLDFR